MNGGPTRLSVVVPIFEAGETLEACLTALAAAAGDDDEIIVADDGSTDDAVAALPEALARRVTVVRSDTNIGRGPIRNLGARAANGDAIVFVDADVAVRDGALDAIRSAFDDGIGRVSLFGSYDDRPAARSWVSQYRNLLHHHTHHTHGDTATHFWTGLGAVRRDTFEELGGLDEASWARDMEDVEFGHRLVDAGHTIHVLPHVQGTHLKRFTLRSMIETDLIHRAIPWSTLMLRNDLRADVFVTSWEQSVSAACAAVAAAAGVAFVVVVATGVPGASVVAGVAAAAGVVFVVVNLPLWRFFARTRSGVFALACVPLHLVHAGASALGFGLALGSHLTRSVRKAVRRGR